MTRRLSLRKETLTELSTVELAAVAGGATRNCHLPTDYCASHHVRCLTDLVSMAMDPCVSDLGCA